MEFSWNIADELRDLRRHGHFRRRRVLGGGQGREVVSDGRRLINFCSNDYLGLAADGRLRATLARAVERWGVGAGASPLVCGYTAAHQALEEALACFTGRARAVLFPSGYAANLGCIGALLGRGDRVLEDRLNHASLLDGGRLSGARFERFRHGDSADLERRLAAGKSTGRTLVVSDGTFSMDGDHCVLASLVGTAQRHGAWLMIDDAHGLGVHGRGGRGLVDAQQFTSADVQLLVGTFGKAFGTCGAFVAGDEEPIELLVQRARQLVFSTALPAALAETTLASLAIVEAEEWRRERLRELVARFRAGLAQTGIAAPVSQTPIQPLIVGDAERAVALSAALEEAGFLVAAIRPPTVPEGTSRLRVTLTAAHTTEDVDRLLEALTAAWRALPESR